MTKDSSEEVSSSPTDDEALLKAEKRVLRKIDLRILSLTALAYLLNHIDKTNMGALSHNLLPSSHSTLANAKIMNTDIEGASMVEQLDLHGNRFGNVITTYYTSFILAELVGNYFLKLMGPSLHITRIVVSYGIVCTCSAAVQSYEGMLINRFFLGLTQGGLYSVSEQCESVLDSQHTGRSILLLILVQRHRACSPFCHLCFILNPLNGDIWLDCYGLLVYEWFGTSCFRRYVLVKKRSFLTVLQE